MRDLLVVVKKQELEWRLRMSLPVNLGLNLSCVQPQFLAQYAAAAEEMGFESLWIGEHICVPMSESWWKGPEQEKHLGDDEALAANRRPFEPDAAFLDPFLALMHIASVTEHVRLGTGIYMVPLRHPILTAKMAASLDLLSGGRLELGVGLGWLPDEYSFLNSDWAKRGRVMDEGLRCIHALLTQSRPSFTGEFYSFPEIGFEPKPVQTRLPILVGGDSKAAFRRAGELATGWYGAPEHNAAVREQLDRFGRSSEPFSFSSISVGMVDRADLDIAAQLGTTRCVVTPWERHSVGEVGEQGFAELEAFCKKIELTA